MPSKIANIDWEQLNPPSPYKNLSCVYFVHLMDPKAPSRPLSIQRFMGIDKNGVIEIGFASDLSVKIWHFKETLLGKPGTDAGGWNLGYIFDNNKWMRDTFRTKLELLGCIRFTYVSTKKDLLITNGRKAIDHYIGHFAEFPLVTGQVPGVSKRPKGLARAPVMKASLEKVLNIDPMQLDMIDLAGSPRNPLTKKSCVYWARLADRTDPSKTVPIRRFKGIDRSGTFVIGKTGDLARRIRQIRYDIKHAGRTGEWAQFGHMYDLCSPLRKLCGPKKDLMDRLKISYIEIDRSDLDCGEIWTVNKYMGRFAETAPFNSQIPGDTRRHAR